MGTAVKTSLWKRAFFNQYNYILLGSTALFTLATGSWLPAVVGVGAEVLWMVLGVDTKGFRRWVGAQESKEEQQRLTQERGELLYGLEDRYTERYEALWRMTAEIRKLADENQGLETTLIQDEMAKLDQLLDSFLQHGHLSPAALPLPEREPGLRRGAGDLQQPAPAAPGGGSRVQASLKQALSLAGKRLQKHEQIEGAWKALSVQLDTLEKSFDYLKSHILGIGTREELAAALDDLVSGVSSVSELDTSVDGHPRRAARRRRRARRDAATKG